MVVIIYENLKMSWHLKYSNSKESHKNFDSRFNSNTFKLNINTIYWIVNKT